MLELVGTNGTGACPGSHTSMLVVIQQDARRPDLKVAPMGACPYNDTPVLY